MASAMLASSGALPLLALSEADLGRGVLFVIFLIMCVAVHEFGHAWVADRLGDPLPRQQGRVTLNPLAHADILGTVLLPLVLVAFGGRVLGWGKPVQWTGHPRYLTRRFSMRTIHLMVSIAGPAMNLLLALALSILAIVMVKTGLGRGFAMNMLLGLVQGGEGIRFVPSHSLIAMNLGLMFFNLLPVPPLDGRSFLHFLPRFMDPIRDFLFRYGGFVFLVLVLTGPIFGGLSLLDIVMYPFNLLGDLYLRSLFTVVFG